MSQDNSVYTSKLDTLKLPEGAIALLIQMDQLEGGQSTAEVQMFHNFKNDATSQTNDERLLYVVGQGLLSICTNEPMRVVSKGVEYVKKFFEKNGVDFDAMNLQEYDIAHIKPNGGVQ